MMVVHTYHFSSQNTPHGILEMCKRLLHNDLDAIVVDARGWIALHHCGAPEPMAPVRQLLAPYKSMSLDVDAVNEEVGELV